MLFWTVSDIFREQAKSWAPLNAGYERKRTIKVEGRTWTVVLKVHVVPDQRMHSAGGPKIRFKSSVTLWPPEPSKRYEAKLVQAGWYRSIQRAVGTGGYSGKWMPSPSGTFGDFWKDLPSVAAVRRETAWLEGLELEGTAKNSSSSSR
jgi:hypothetical protein